MGKKTKKNDKDRMPRIPHIPSTLNVPDSVDISVVMDINESTYDDEMILDGKYDIVKTDTAIEISAVLDDVKKGDIKITAEIGKLTIKVKGDIFATPPIPANVDLISLKPVYNENTKNLTITGKYIKKIDLKIN